MGSPTSRVIPGDAERVVLGLVVKAGSLVEADDEQGLAHFVEHLACEGTAHYSRKELQTFFELAGIAIGSHTQAYTPRIRVVAKELEAEARRQIR